MQQAGDVAAADPVKARANEVARLRRDHVRRVPAFYAGDICTPIEAQHPLIAGKVNPGETQVWFGASGAKKSFVVVGLAASVATGTPWCGSATTKAPVVYLASEGGANIRRRFKAWAKGNDASLEDAQLAVIIVPIDLFGEVAQLRLFLLEFEESTGQWPGLVVVDTLAMSSSADENSAHEVGTLLANIRKAAAGAAVLLVHHSGLSDKDRERGSYVLRASADRTVRVESTADGLVELHCVKSKDDQPFETITLRPRVVTLPDLDVYGEPLTSIVLDQTDIVASPKVKPKRQLNDDARLALRLLRDLLVTTGHTYEGEADIPQGARVVTFTAWKQAHRDAGAPDDTKSAEARRKAFERANTALQAAGLVRVVDGHAYVREARHG